MATEQQPFHRTPNTQMASWFLDIHSAGRLNLDPPYQRRSVWNMEFRKFFVDSIIRNYPTQSIFLDVSVEPDVATDYKVLDGKQRLTSLIGFCNDEFTTPTSLADFGIQDLYYSQLSREIKTRILSYMFTVESVTNVTAAELNQAFDRLNRNVSRLNSQELRHAQFGGAFISKMERLANDDFWEEIGLITPARRRRMLDVEYVSELYVVALRGIQDGKSYLDDIYAELDEEVVGEASADRLFRATRKRLSQVNDTLPISGSRYSNVADFYSLWTAFSRLNARTAPTPSLAARRLKRFETELGEQRSGRSRAYLLAARQGSNKSANRELRATTLLAVLEGK